ncbi:unnamed protein product [Calypogeia fissa]
MRGPPGAGGGGAGAGPGPSPTPYSYHHSGSYRERRRARRQALALAAAASASASSSATGAGVPLAPPGVGGTQLGVGLPWSASTRSSVANCSSSEDGIGIAVGGGGGSGGGGGGGGGGAELHYYYHQQQNQNPNQRAQQQYQQQHHLQRVDRRRWGGGGVVEGGHMTMNYEENIIINNNNNHHPSVRMALAMGLGFGPRYGDAQSADVVLKLKSSVVPCGGVVGGGVVEACGSGGVGVEDGSAATGMESEGGVGVCGSGGGEELVVVAPLYLHSKALRRSEFFDARLSERWRYGAETGCSSSGLGGKGGEGSSHSGVVELTLDNCKDPRTYVRCIQLLYVPDRVKHTCFTSVEDALNILEVAAELLFHDCVTACMRYLESVPWTHENECAIRACVSSLHLQPSEDLAARLCSPESVPDVKPVDIMQGVLGELLTLVTTGAPSKARDITERVLLANVQPASSPAFATVNEVALFKEFSSNLEILKVQLRKFANFFSWNGHQVNVACSALRWLLDELFTLQIADEAVRMFSEEKELAQLMVSRTYQNPFTDTLFVILVRMLQALQRGDVLSPRSVRLTLLTTWLPVIAKLGNDDDNFAHDETHRNMEEGLGAVVETLPMVDQEMIFRIWIGACLKCRRAWPDLSDAFESWCSKLRQAHREGDVERSGGSCSEGACLTTS